MKLKTLLRYMSNACLLDHGSSEGFGHVKASLRSSKLRKNDARLVPFIDWIKASLI